MLRYYMTAETRQALIAESNRLIASRAARRHAADSDLAAFDGAVSMAPRAAQRRPYDAESAFARLVADLETTRADVDTTPSYLETTPAYLERC